VSQKTSDHVLDNSTRAVRLQRFLAYLLLILGQRQVFLVSHRTYLV